MVDWKEAWRPVVDQVGKDLSDGQVSWGADRIERSAIGEYLEPLEFSCALHTDPEVARTHGYADVATAYTAVQTFAMEALWTGEGALFTSADRDVLAYQSQEPSGDNPIRFLNEARTASLLAKSRWRQWCGRGAQDRRLSGGSRVLRRRQDLRGSRTGRAAYGQTFAEAQQESAVIWSPMSAVAADNVLFGAPYQWRCK